MDRIDFYILADARPNAVELFACRLIEKAFDQGHRIFVRSADDKQAALLDQLLWSFRDGSFLPHAPLPQATDADPIVIGAGHGLPAERDLVVNLAADAPEQWQSFKRLAEVVGPAHLNAARARYRLYRDAGIKPHYHKLGEN